MNLNSYDINKQVSSCQKLTAVYFNDIVGSNLKHRTTIRDIIRLCFRIILFCIRIDKHRLVENVLHDLTCISFCMTYSYKIHEKFRVQMNKQKMIFFMPLAFEDIFRNAFCT